MKTGLTEESLRHSEMTAEKLFDKLQRRLRIAYLTNVETDFTGLGGSVHVSQVSRRFISRGHRLYTNLKSESDRFIKLTAADLLRKGGEIDVFYIRIDGWHDKDELTLLRQANPFAPCIWEINAPLEEMKTVGKSEEVLRKLKKRRKELAKKVDTAICVSDEMQKYARDELGIKETFVIPNGSDTELFSREKRDESIYDRTKFKVLWSGSPQYQWQGFRIVQELARALKGKGMNDILVIATSPGVSADNLLCLGRVPYNDMPRYIASADVGLCIYENIAFYGQFYFSPLKLYDYMASGIPVVGTNAGQIKQVIEEEQNGLLTDNTIDDLIGRILFLKAHPGVARDMGLKGRKAALDKYNWESVVLRTESILLEAVERHKTSLDKQPERAIAEVAFNYWKLVMSVHFSINLLRRMVNKAKNSVMQVWKRRLRRTNPPGNINNS